MRIAQQDLLYFALKDEWESPEWPEGYWPKPDINVTDNDKYANKTTLVVGGGHSAIGSILALNSLIKKFPNAEGYRVSKP